MDLPDGYTVDIPAFNKTGYNFSETFGGVQYDVGIKTNTSVTKNMNMTINCSDMAIGLYGMNILAPISLDLSSAFVCNSATDLIGMNSSLKKWNKLIDDMHMGGAADYIEITVPVAYSTSNTFNWTDDSGASGQDVDDYVSCRNGGNSNTVCKVPVSMGFSAYTVTIPASSGSSTTTSGGGGGGVATSNKTTSAGSESDGSSPESEETPSSEDKKGIGDLIGVDKIVGKVRWSIIAGTLMLVLAIVSVAVWKFLGKKKRRS